MSTEVWSWATKNQTKMRSSMSWSLWRKSRYFTAVMIWTPGISGNRCTKTSKTWPRIQQSITWTTFIYITTTQYNKFFYEIFVSPLQMFARRCCEILHKCLLFLYTMGSEPSDGANWQRRQGWRRMQTTQRSPPYIHDFNESFCFWSDIRRNRNGNK